MAGYDGTITLGVVLKPKDVVKAINEIKRNVEDALSTKTVDKFNDALDKTSKELSDVEDKTNKVSKSTEEMEKSSKALEYKQVVKDIDSLEKKMAKITSQMEMMEALGKESSNSYKMMGVTYDQYAAKLESLYELRKQMEGSGEGILPPGTREEISQTTKLLEYLQSEQTKIVDKMDKMEEAGLASESNKDYAKLGMQYDIIQEQIDATRQKQEELNASIENMPTPADNGAGVPDMSAEVEPQIENVKSQAQMMREAIVTAIKDIPAITKDFMGRAVRFIGNGIGSAIRGFGRLQATIYKTIGNKMLSGFKKLKDSLLGIGHGSNSATRKLRTFIGYAIGIRSVYMLFQKVKQAWQEGMKSLVSYSDEANKSMSMVTSSLTNLKNSIAPSFEPLLNAVAPAISRVIDLLTQGIETAGKFFATLTGQKTFTKAIKQQKDYAESLNNTSSAMNDMLGAYDNLQVISKDSGAGSGSGVEYETQEIDLEDPASKFAELLKKSWEESDFSEVGKLIGTNITEGLQSIPWDEIQQKANKIALSMATFINGLNEGLDLATVGTTLAEGINTLANTLNTFVNKIKWKAIGKNISNGINAWFRDVEWGTVGDTVSDSVVDIFDLVTTTVEGLDVELLTDSIVELVSGVDWGAVLGQIVLGINTITGKLLELIPRLLGGVFELLGNLFEWCGNDTVAGFFKGIADSLKDAANWVRDTFTKYVIDPFKDMLGIHSPSTLFAEFGAMIIAGLKQGIENAWHTITDFFSSAISNLTGMISSGLSGLANAVGTILGAVSQVWQSIWTGIFNFQKGIINGIIGFINAMISALESCINAVGKAINTISVEIPSWVPGGLGGKKLGFDIPPLKLNPIPELAQGAVIPPNNPYLAVVGDQTSGTNIETPLETMIEAFEIALARGNNNQPIMLQLNGKVVAEAVWDEEDKRYKQTGTYRPRYS